MHCIIFLQNMSFIFVVFDINVFIFQLALNIFIFSMFGPSANRDCSRYKSICSALLYSTRFLIIQTLSYNLQIQLVSIMNHANEFRRSYHLKIYIVFQTEKNQFSFFFRTIHLKHFASTKGTLQN